MRTDQDQDQDRVRPGQTTELVVLFQNHVVVS